MHSTKDIALVAGALSNQLRAGLPMDQAVERLAKMQPRYAEFWRLGAKSVGSGSPLSKFLRGHWPPAFVAAIESGEESGNIASVFRQIDETIIIESEVKGHTYKLLYPFGMSLGGVGIFIFFMTMVIPALARSFSSRKAGRSAILELSFWMEATIQSHGWLILVATVLAIYAFVSWLQSPEGRKKLSEFLLETPVLGPALTDLSFGVWAHYMSLMVAAGVPTLQALEKTIAVLPWSLQEIVNVSVHDMQRNKKLSEAFDSEKVAANDPRIRLPFYISVAMKISEETGDVAAELTRVAPSLIKEGVNRMKIVISAFNLLGIAIASAAIATPMGAYYLQLLSSIKHIG